MSRNSNAIFAHHHNSCDDQIYWHEYDINSMITCVFCIMSTAGNMEVIESNKTVTFLQVY
jgi:hypothetical protein